MTLVLDQQASKGRVRDPSRALRNDDDDDHTTDAASGTDVLACTTGSLTRPTTANDVTWQITAAVAEEFMVDMQVFTC